MALDYRYTPLLTVLFLQACSSPDEYAQEHYAEDVTCIGTEVSNISLSSHILAEQKADIVKMTNKSSIKPSFTNSLKSEEFTFCSGTMSDSYIYDSNRNMLVVSSSAKSEKVMADAIYSSWKEQHTIRDTWSAQLNPDGFLQWTQAVNSHNQVAFLTHVEEDFGSNHSIWFNLKSLNGLGSHVIDAFAKEINNSSSLVSAQNSAFDAGLTTRNQEHNLKALEWYDSQLDPWTESTVTICTSINMDLELTTSVCTKDVVVQPPSDRGASSLDAEKFVGLSQMWLSNDPYLKEVDVKYYMEDLTTSGHATEVSKKISEIDDKLKNCCTGERQGSVFGSKFNGMPGLAW